MPSPHSALSRTVDARERHSANSSQYSPSKQAHAASRGFNEERLGRSVWLTVQVVSLCVHCENPDRARWRAVPHKQ